jgi:hypothetical protein
MVLTKNTRNQTPPRLSLEDLWQDVINKCRETIDNPDDLDTIDKFRDHEEVIAALRETVERQKTEPAMALTLRNVWFNLDSLRIFVTALFVGLGATNLSVACIFGGVYLLLEVCCTRFAFSLRCARPDLQTTLPCSHGRARQRETGQPRRRWWDGMFHIATPRDPTAQKTDSLRGNLCTYVG